VHCLFEAKGYPVIGTTVDYFRFRGLEISSGGPLGILGECLIGAACADELGLAPGDQLLSDRPNLLDLAGDYPLKMTVAGVLEESGSPDDRGVFVDLKTAWIIQGLGHGHQDLESPEQAENVVREEGQIKALPSKVVPYTEINESNIDSFHFHGDTSDFPVSAIIGVPKNVKSATLLEARYQNNDRGVQFVRPVESIKELMSVLLRVRQFFAVNTILIAASTFLLTMLVLLLSLKLRQSERETMFKIGCRGGTIMALQAMEILLVVVVSAILVFVVAWLGASMATSHFDSWITRGGNW
jgi:putative ABC transport system permease protein